MMSKYRKDRIIFAQGIARTRSSTFQEGKVKTVVTSDQGKEAVVGIIEPDQFLGQRCLNGQSLRIGRMPDQRSNRVEEDLIDQLFNSSEKRLARLLLLLANFGKEGRPQPIDASFDQGTLAEMIGTTRSRVSHDSGNWGSSVTTLEVHRSLLNAVLQERPQIDEDEKQN